MKGLKKNNKGFTLIELLAVIVILGVLMIIAVPMVSKYITQAKKNAFVATAKAYVSSARYAFLNEDYTTGCSLNINSGTGGSIYILFDYIDVDKTGGMSSFNKPIDTAKSYVVIEADNTGKFTYYVRMLDAAGNGWSAAINEDSLDKDDVANNVDNPPALGTYIKNGATSNSTAGGSCTK